MEKKLVFQFWFSDDHLSVLHPSALPPLFKEELKNKEAVEGGDVTLHCELTKAAPVEWQKDQKILKTSKKYKMRQEGTRAELVIHEIAEEDAGDYTCVCGEHQTTAVLTVQGKTILTPYFLTRNVYPLLAGVQFSMSVCSTLSVEFPFI